MAGRPTLFRQYQSPAGTPSLFRREPVTDSTIDPNMLFDDAPGNFDEMPGNFDTPGQT